MDYRGQQLSEHIYYILTILFGAIAWVVGFQQGDFTLTVYGWAVGLGLSMILCIPDWPFYNYNPVEWLKEIGSYETQEVTEGKGTKEKKDKGKESSSSSSSGGPSKVGTSSGNGSETSSPVITKSKSK